MRKIVFYLVTVTCLLTAHIGLCQSVPQLLQQSDSLKRIGQREVSLEILQLCKSAAQQEETPHLMVQSLLAEAENHYYFYHFDSAYVVSKMTQTERDAIGAPGNPATGLLIYQTDQTPGFYFFNGSSWQAISSGGAGIVETATLINSGASNTLGVTYAGPSRTDADNSPAFRFVSDEGYFVDITNTGSIGTSWIWYTNNDCTGTAYADPQLYGPGAVFASPFDNSLVYIDQTASTQNVAAMSRYIVGSNVCQVISQTADYYPIQNNAPTTTGINLSASTTYLITF